MAGISGITGQLHDLDPSLGLYTEGICGVLRDQSLKSFNACWDSISTIIGLSEIEKRSRCPFSLPVHSVLKAAEGEHGLSPMKKMSAE